jgi:hypothetical protein
VISFQTYVGSAYSSHPVRWIETAEAARTGYAFDKTAEKQVEKAVDPDKGKPRSASGDILDISPEAKKALGATQSDTGNSLENGESGNKKADILAVASEKLPSSTELTPEQKQQVADMKVRDQEVRVHEMAHVLAGGAHVTSGPSYEYEIGPDGRGYAVGGSVGIDTSPVKGDPEATIAKMQAVAAAALAPAQPSGQDLKVAAAACQAEAEARADLSQMKPQGQEEISETEQPAEESVAAFSIVKSADKTVDDSPKTNASDSVMPSLVVQAKTGSDFSPSAAYKAQSTAASFAPRFSAFA